MSLHLKLPVELPPCGMLIGTGIMNSKAGYLVGTGQTHTTWVPQLFSPLELLDRILEDNQGNFVQYWGFSGGLGPVTFARHHALEDLGMVPPEPDWTTGANLLVKDWIDPEPFKDRSGAGVLKLIRAAAEKGLYIALLYTEAHSQWSRQFLEAGGKFYLGYDFGERFTFRYHHEKELRSRQEEGKGEATPSLRVIAEDLMGRVREHVAERHATGWGNVAATSGNFYLDYEIASGADIPMTEDFCMPLCLASALSRGLYRQYGLPIWGSHLAHEHYSWIPYASEFKFPLLRAAFFQKYMAGCKMVLNESGGWYLEAALVTDSPMFQTPRVPGRPGLRDPHLAIPYAEEARETFDRINYHSPTAKAYRREISDFYNYVKIHGTPAGQPETTIAAIKGNLDLGGATHRPNGAVAGMYQLAETNPLWYSGAPERGWDIFSRVFHPAPDVLKPWQNLVLSGTPYGPVDITSFANDHADADFLRAQYKALIFTGWNTSSDQQYRTLCRYVREGGILFVALPHLSRNETRNYAAFGVEELVNGGDFSELCGARVKGRGKRFYWATAPAGSRELGFEFPRRFGILSVCMGDVEFTGEVEVLATDDEEFRPVLWRHRLGRGEVYFLNTWAYPGALDQDFGPGSQPGSAGLVGYVYRAIARKARGNVWISDDRIDAGPECAFIGYSYFPEDGSVCLQNIDFQHPHQCFLHHFENCEPIRLEPGEFRLLTTRRASS